MGRPILIDLLAFSYVFKCSLKYASPKIMASLAYKNPQTSHFCRVTNFSERRNKKGSLQFPPLFSPTQTIPLVILRNEINYAPSVQNVCNPAESFWSRNQMCNKLSYISYNYLSVIQNGNYDPEISHWSLQKKIRIGE